MPLALFNYKKQQFEAMKDSLVGKRFKTHLMLQNQREGQEVPTHVSSVMTGKEVKVLALSPLEPDTCPESHWQTITVVEVDTHSALRPDRGRRNEDMDLSQAKRISFWDLIYEGESKSLSDLALQVIPKEFDAQDAERLADSLAGYIQKKFETCYEFLERVTE